MLNERVRHKNIEISYRINNKLCTIILSRLLKRFFLSSRQNYRTLKFRQQKINQQIKLARQTHGKKGNLQTWRTSFFFNFWVHYSFTESCKPYLLSESSFHERVANYPIEIYPSFYISLSRLFCVILSTRKVMSFLENYRLQEIGPHCKIVQDQRQNR